ncbi:MAG: CotH kinase family protein [Ruminococcus sp.]|nr:CotH kinase family protein [Ruminococcus sp.]
MRKLKFRFIIALFLPLLILAGVFAIGLYQTEVTAADTVTYPLVTEELTIKPQAVSPTPKIEDDKSVYTRDGYGDDTSVVTMYLTARRGNDSENSDNEFGELAKHSKIEYIEEGTDPHRTECIIQEGDENGPKEGYYGYGLTAPNATVSIRGNTSSRMKLKSYKITLHDEAEPWRSQTVINLNKHPYDVLGFRQKFTADLIKDIPGMFSLRTQFVHLYVKDETTGEENPQFTDYGFFTQIEQPNVSYLKNHGLDENGEFYKAENFEFADYYDELKLVSDPEFDENAFSDLVENKGKNNDYTDLINMVQDINNPAISIEDTFNRYFDEENFMKWLASQIIILNVDNINRNFLLYSPPNSEKFYFIIYDCDGMLRLNEQNLRRDVGIDDMTIEEFFSYERGLTNYFGVKLYNRLFRDPEYVDKLSKTIEEMYSEYLTPEKISDISKKYAAVVKPYRNSLPDSQLISESVLSEYDEILERLPILLSDTVKSYYETIEGIAPFFIGLPEKSENGYVFRWDKAYNFAGLPIKYKIKVSSDFFENDIIFEADDLSSYSYSYDGDLAPGIYYVIISAYDDAGHYTDAGEYISYQGGSKKFGTLSFTILPDGTIDYTPPTYDFTMDVGVENLEYMKTLQKIFLV